MNGAVAGAGLDAIIAGSRNENVAAIAEERHIIAGTGVDRIVAVARKERIVADIADQRVVALIAVENVVAGIASERVVAKPAPGHVIASIAQDRVVTCAAIDQIVARSAVQAVRAAEAAETVVIVSAAQGLVRRRTVIDCSGVDSRVVDQECQIVEGQNFEARNRVKTLVGPVEQPVVANQISASPILNDRRVVAQGVIQPGVGAGAAVDGIITLVAPDSIVARAGIQCIGVIPAPK